MFFKRFTYSFIKNCRSLSPKRKYTLLTKEVAVPKTSTYIPLKNIIPKEVYQQLKPIFIEELEAERKRVFFLQFGESFDFYGTHTTLWKERGGRQLALQLFQYYKLIPDLFSDSTLLENLDANLEVQLKSNERILYGRIVPPRKLREIPDVRFSRTANDYYYTLLCVSPDDNIFNFHVESLRWMITNIKGGAPEELIRISALQNADTACEYLPPTPARGTGYLRYVFLLLEHTKRLKLGTIQPGGDFSTRDFLQSHEARIKGLNFFQSCWDESVDVTYTQTLGLLKPPVYEPKSRYPGKVKRRRYMPKPKEPQYKKTLLRDK